MQKIKIIGAGLAGSEAALYLANNNFLVQLWEMRPYKMTEAHKTDYFAELVCSNSLKSIKENSAPYMLKKELEILGSELLKVAYQCQVPAGNALAVDRNLFSKTITERIKSHKNIEIINKEFTFDEINEDEIILFTPGPLISENLSNKLNTIFGNNNLYFYDAISPIIDADSIDYSKVFFGSRYNPEDKSYLNIPLDKDEYYSFVNNLINSEKYELKDFEKKIKYFESCMPIEEMAKRGLETLSFGPLKPVGFEYIKVNNKKPYAIVQLRQENLNKTAYNLVGCQTQMKISEQKRVFSMLPGLKNAVFLRYGSVHRNSFINSPILLNYDLSLKSNNNFYFAGQFIGVEGYVESIMSGLIAAIFIKNKLNKNNIEKIPVTTISGALLNYVTTPIKNFQPMNANFGILPSDDINLKKKDERYKQYIIRGLEELKKWVERYENR